jgi:hypothetical protein
VSRSVLVILGLVIAVAAIGWAMWRALPTNVPRDGVPVPVERTSIRNDPDPANDQTSPLIFRAADLPFRYERGDSGAAWPVEPVGGGVGIADFDRDGRIDLFFAQGVPLPVGKAPNAPSDVLLRNRGGEDFDDVSSSAGLISKGYGNGVTVADFDADGFPDVYVTRYGANTLWHNEGDGHFSEVTDEAAVGCELWSLGAAFSDMDGDGDLDLFVANYFTFDPAEAPFARDPVTGAADYGAPASFEGQPDVLYRNDGDGRFTDIAADAGIRDDGRGMGVLATDFDDDGRIDILVANDAQNNSLWHNLGNGRFEDVALSWGIAVNAKGQTEANMGIAYGDTDGDGVPDLLISHLVNEHDTLWRGRPAGGAMFFRDETFEAGLGLDSRRLTGWGTAFGDFDHDGLTDLVVANGHIRREANQQFVYDNPPILWHNRGGRFANVTASAGPYFRALHMARGLAAGDLDDDGDLDLVVVHHHKPSVVLWNESPRRGAWLVVELHGAGMNRDAIGAKITATVGGRAIVRTLDGGGSYISANDACVHFGLGPANHVDQLEVRWPSGRIQSWREVAVNRRLRLNDDSPSLSSR